MQQKGYQAKNMIIDIRKANYSGPLSVLPFMVLTFWVYDNVNGFDLDDISLVFALSAFLLILCLTILHELIHGIIWNSFSAYCTCSEPLKKWQYLLGIVMPTLILGVGATAASVVTNQLLLFFLSEFMIISGGGDFLITLKTLLYHTDKKETLYCDHPYECGFVVFEK
ncbi:MAG: DUF3267 domain-containing protein [Lachnospiraceae bacterium]|nr:DUF3267 domain-containing protein [Lachnospiraceae bacterium]